jgi:tetratricopeptide (TPR) repeat protein
VNTNKTRRISHIGLLFLLTAVPLVFSAKSYNFIYIKEIIFSAGTALLLAVLFFQNKIEIKKAVLLPLIYLGWAAVSVFLSRYAYAGINALEDSFMFFIFFFLAANTGKEPGDIRDMIAVSSLPFIAAGIIQAVAPLAMKEFMVFGDRVPATFGNPNFFGAYIAGISPVLLGGIIRHKGAKRYFYSALLFSAVFCLISTGSKAALLGFALTPVLFYFLIFKKDTEAKKCLVIFTCAAAVILTAATAMIGMKLTGKTDRKEWAKNESVFFRANTWKGSLGIIRDNPAAGTGPGTFQVVYPKYRPAEIMLWSSEHSYETLQPENIILQTAADTGVVGLLILLFLVYIIIRNAKKEHNDFLAGFLAILLVNQFGVDINYAPSAMLLCLYAGILMSGAGGGSFVMGGRAKNSAVVVVLAAVIFITGAQFRKFVSGIYLKQAVFYSQSRQWDNGIADYLKALDNDKYNLTAAYFLARSYSDSEQAGGPQKAIDRYTALEKLAPDYVLLHYQKAQVYSSMSNYDAAGEELKKALATDPYLEPALVELAQMHLNLKHDPVEAEKYMKKALEKNGNDASLYNGLGNIYFMSKRLPEAVEAFKKAVDLKQDKDYYYNLGCVYFAGSDVKNARFYLEKAAQMDPGDQRVADVLRQVRMYEKLKGVGK